MAKCSTREMSAYKSKLKILRIIAIELEIPRCIFKLPNYIVTNMNYLLTVLSRQGTCNEPGGCSYTGTRQCPALYIP